MSRVGRRHELIRRIGYQSDLTLRVGPRCGLKYIVRRRGALISWVIVLDERVPVIVDQVGLRIRSDL